MTHLALVRHGETAWNSLGLIQGHTDIPLNETGRAQARQLAGAVAAQRWDGIATSTLARAVETAEIVARILGLGAPVGMSGLRERGYGAAEGMDWSQFDEEFAATPVPGLEPRHELHQRVTSALAELATRHPGGRVLVVTHHGVLRMLAQGTKTSFANGEVLGIEIGD